MGQDRGRRPRHFGVQFIPGWASLESQTQAFGAQFVADWGEFGVADPGLGAARAAEAVS